MINLPDGDAIFKAAVAALEQGAALVEARAKARAPVRNIFGMEYTFRIKTASEMKASRVTTGGEVGTATWQQTWKAGDAPQGKLASMMPRKWRQRRMATLERLLVAYDAEMMSRRRGYAPIKTVLSRRGASEVRTKRAAFTTFEHAGIGGRLRGEIKSLPPTVTGERAEAWVISPTPYAKYQEYGTRHNRAHPYLRPAAEESRSEVIRAIAEAVKGASRTGGSSTEIEIVVRL